MPEELKEKVLVFENKESKSFKDKTLWELTTGEGGRFTCWDKGIADAIPLEQQVKVRYEVKKTDKYTNFTIKAVSIAKDDGSWGEWIEQAKTAGRGGKPFDSMAANKRTCLEAAATIVAASMAKTSVANPVASTLEITAKLMAGLFAEKPAETPKAVPAKKAQMVEAEEVQEEEAVPF